jgi:hypothetical protein
VRSPGGLLAVICVALAGLAAGCGEDEAERVDGEGYSYAVPVDWRDVSDQAEDEPGLEVAGYQADTLVIGEREEGFSTNVNVIRESGIPPEITASQYAEVTVAGLRDPVAAGLSQELVEVVRGLRPSKISEIRDAELGGEPAATWGYTSTQGMRVMRIRQVAAVMDGAAYSVTLTALPEKFEEGLDSFDEVVDSWEWD